MNVEVRQSEIHGSGVFAKEVIAQDHWQYIYGYEKKHVPGDITEKYGFAEEGSDIMFVPYAPFCFTNHSTDPNCEVMWDEDTKTMSIGALREIRIGEELTIDYGFDPSKIGGR